MINAYYDYLKRSINPNGRTKKSDYYYAALMCIIQIIIVYFVYKYSLHNYSKHITFIYSLVTNLWLIFNIIAFMNLSIRRLHDANLPGYIVFVCFFFYLFGIIPYLFFMSLDSKDENNKY